MRTWLNDKTNEKLESNAVTEPYRQVLAMHEFHPKQVHLTRRMMTCSGLIMISGYCSLLVSKRQIHKSRVLRINAIHLCC